MKCQLHVSEILTSNHPGLIKIASSYFSVSAVKDSGVNAVVPLVRQSIFSCVFPILRVPRRFYPHAITFSLHCLVEEDSLGLKGCLWETKWVKKLYPCCGAVSIFQCSGQSGFGLSQVLAGLALPPWRPVCRQVTDSVFILIMHCGKSEVLIQIQLKTEYYNFPFSVAVLKLLSYVHIFFFIFICFFQDYPECHIAGQAPGTDAVQQR